MTKQDLIGKILYLTDTESYLLEDNGTNEDTIYMRWIEYKQLPVLVFKGEQADQKNYSLSIVLRAIKEGNWKLQEPPIGECLIFN